MIKYGFLPVLERLKLFRLRGKLFFRRPAEKDLAVMNKEKRLRLALEELGPTFIKIGQLLSNRVDLLPASYIQELSLLQDQVKPFPAAKAKEAVERELKLPLPELFQEFAEEPLAAASIAQVHRARLFNGEDVVLKIKRPEIEQQMLMDLEILSVIAEFIDRQTPPEYFYRFGRLAEELTQIVKGELDFLAEARNARRFRQNFKDHPHVYIPRVYWEYTTRNVLTLEYREGISLSHILQQPREGELRPIAEIFTDSLFKQVFVDGFFHGDLHPGNIKILPDGRLFFMDFGTAGSIDDELRSKFVLMLKALREGDTETLVDELLDFAFVPEAVDRREITRDLEGFLEQYYTTALKDVNIRELVQNVARLAGKHQIRFPYEFLLLMKALVTAEGTVARIDPGFNMAEAARKYGFYLQRSRWKTSWRRVRRGWHGYCSLAEEFPYRAMELLNLAASGNLKVQVEIEKASTWPGC